jgi:hypothetical protein
MQEWEAEQECYIYWTSTSTEQVHCIRKLLVDVHGVIKELSKSYWGRRRWKNLDRTSCIFISDFFSCVIWGCTVPRFNISPPSLHKELSRRGTYVHGGININNRSIVRKRYITKNMITIVPQPESVLIWYKKKIY